MARLAGEEDADPGETRPVSEEPGTRGGGSPAVGRDHRHAHAGRRLTRLRGFAGFSMPCLLSINGLVGKVVSGAKPRAACIFPLPPTRAGTIRLVHVTARRSAWPASPRVGSARGGAVWRGGRAEAAGGGATRRDRTTEGPQGSPGDQAKRHGGSDQAKAGRQSGQAPR